MNFFICNRYDSYYDDIYLIGKNYPPNKKICFYLQEKNDYNSIYEKTYILTKNNDKNNFISEGVNDSEELQIIDYPYHSQQDQHNLKKNILNKSKCPKSFINQFHNYSKINGNNKNKNKIKKFIFNTSSNLVRNIDDRLPSNDIELEINDTIKGEDNLNLFKIKKEKGYLNENNVKRNNAGKSVIKDLISQNLNLEKKDSSKNKNSQNKNLYEYTKKNKKLLHSSKSFIKENKNPNNYKNINEIPLKSITNKSTKNNIILNCCKTFRNKCNNIVKKKNSHSFFGDKEINYKNFKYDYNDIVETIKENIFRKIKNLENRKLLEKEQNKYTAKEVIRQFRHYKRKNYV